jgi:hypothetical protein
LDEGSNNKLTKANGRQNIPARKVFPTDSLSNIFTAVDFLFYGVRSQFEHQWHPNRNERKHRHHSRRKRKHVR